MQRENVSRHRASNLLLVTLASLAVIALHPAAALADVDAASGESEVDLFDDDVERNPGGWSRFQFSVGMTRMDADGVYNLGLPDRPPLTLINFDRVGLKETDSSHWISVTWRSARSRWGLWFANWRYDVTGSRLWQDEWRLPNEQTIPVGAEVRSDFDADWYVAEATYSLVQTSKLDAGIGLGIHSVDLDTSLTAEVELGDGRAEVVHVNLDTLAPLPNVLAFLYWKPSSRWDFVARYGWFGLDVSKYSGRMTNSHLIVSYALGDRTSLGVGYQYVHLDVDVDEDRYTQIYDVDFDGPLALFRFRF